MARHPGARKADQSLEKSAMEIAQGIQKPGQTKEQTRLIARGIEKGIAQYKKRQSAKERELNKALKQLERDRNRLAEADSASASGAGSDHADAPGTGSGQGRLPWVLLLLTWVGIAAAAFVLGWPSGQL
jgi:hypothetical protein